MIINTIIPTMSKSISSLVTFSSNGTSMSLDHNALLGLFSKSNEVPMLSANGISIVSKTRSKLITLPLFSGVITDEHLT